MLQFSSKNILQFRNCFNLVNYLNRNQRTLTKLIKDDQQNKFNESNNQLYKIKDQLNENKLNDLHNSLLSFSQSKGKSVNFKSSKKLLDNSQDDLHSNKPSREQIEEFHHYVEEMFPKFFTERINLAYFDEFITIEDNQSGITKKEFGFNNLVKKISFIRIYFSTMHSFNTMKVLSIAKIPEEGLVKLRWRIISKGRLLIFLQFWKIKEFKRREFWTDGIVYFYLNKHGKVKRLVIEKVEKDKDENLAKIPLEKIAKI